MCIAVSKDHNLDTFYASSEQVLDYLTLMNSRGVGWKEFELYIRGAQLFNNVKECKEEEKKRANACSRRNERRKVVAKEILHRISRLRNTTKYNGKLTIF